MSTIPHEENWHRPWHIAKIHTAHKSLEFDFNWADVRVGKVARGVDYTERKGINYISPGKKIWGVMFIKRFKELFVL